MAYERGVINWEAPRGLMESPHYQDMYTPNANFGDQVYMTYGSPQGWNEFGDLMMNEFSDLNLKVDRKKLFPSDVHLTSSADRNIPFGRQVQRNPHIDSEAIDKYEQEWLEKNTGMAWELQNEDNMSTGIGLLRAMGKFLPDPREGHLAVTREGMFRSRDFYPGGDDPQTGEPYVYPPYENIPGHEYGHYLDLYLGGGNEYLGDVVRSIMDELGGQYGGITQEQVYNAFMNDPRTAHLDVEDKVNKQTPFYQNNPREILGKLYTTSLMESERIFENDHENIARAFGAMFGKQGKVQGHGKKITDQRGGVMSALANILGQ